jgi:hypothetical protein
MTKGCILISILITTSMLTFLTTSSFAVAENPEGIVIVRGGPTAYNESRLNTPPLENRYVAGDYPSVIVVSKYGNGGVAAAGIAATLSNEDRWNADTNPGPHLDILLDKTFQWMNPGATKVLWYEGYGVYEDQKITGNASEIGDALRALGYTMTADSTEPISDIDLGAYDIVVIPGIQLGARYSGGDPSLLPDADVTALVDFVSAGGGLLVINNADYAGYNFFKVSNKILAGFDFPYLFQSDTLRDTETWGSERYTYEIDTTTEIGMEYQAATGKNVIGFYKPHSLTPPVLYGVAASIIETRPTQSPQVTPGFRPTIVAAKPGEIIETIVKVINTGKVEVTYSISVVDDLGWQIEFSPETLTIPEGGEDNVVVRITVDPAIGEKVQNLVRITVSAMGIQETVVLSTASYFPLTESPYPLLPDNHPMVRKNPFFYQFSTPSLIVGPPAKPIIIGTETSNTLDETYREPYPIPIRRGEFPVIAAADEVESGRVIVYGAGPSFRTSPSSHFTVPALRMEEIGFNMIGWLVRWENAAQHKILFYWTSGAFHDADRLSEWIDYLRSVGYRVDTFSDGITAARLEPYSVLMFIGPEREFTSAEREAIRDWVRAGGGLFLSDQADYGGYCRAVYNNPVLETLGVNIRIQDDQATDNLEFNRWPWDLRVYLTDHPVWYPPLAASAVAEPGALTVNAGEKATFILTIFNNGTETDTYRIEVTSEKGWPVTLEQEEVTLAGGQVENIEIIADAISVEDLKRENRRFSRNDYNVKVTGTGVTAEASFRLTAELPRAVSTVPWVIIVVAVVVIIVVAVAIYFVLLKKK